MLQSSSNLDRIPRSCPFSPVYWVPLQNDPCSVRNSPQSCTVFLLQEALAADRQLPTVSKLLSKRRPVNSAVVLQTSGHLRSTLGSRTECYKQRLFDHVAPEACTWTIVRHAAQTHYQVLGESRPREHQQLCAIRNTHGILDFAPNLIAAEGLQGSGCNAQLTTAVS